MALEYMGKAAKVAARFLSLAGTEDKNRALTAIAAALREHTVQILAANALDLENVQKNGLSDALLDRLRLTEERIEQMAAGVDEVVALADPVGRILEEDTRPNGLHIQKWSVPMGVIGIIYEARPNVTVDAAALCLKAGNAVILRGGKEAIHSNTCLAELMRQALESAGFPADCVALVTDTSRNSANEMMRMHQYLDLLIPRGGAGLIRAVCENSSVPVIETGTGNCHIFVDATADTQMAADIIFNAKCSRPSVCNAAETMLIHKDIAAAVLPDIAQKLWSKGTQIRGCAATRAILGTQVVPVTQADYETEFLDYIIACRVVEDFDQAVEHIVKYTSGHSECIVTGDDTNAGRFLREIDAAAVYVNASTRFTDGGCFGFGAEIGISTQKLHARGPMGLRQLTGYKYTVTGNGQTR